MFLVTPAIPEGTVLLVRARRLGFYSSILRILIIESLFRFEMKFDLLVIPRSIFIKIFKYADDECIFSAREVNCTNVLFFLKFKFSCANQLGKKSMKQYLKLEGLKLVASCFIVRFVFSQLAFYKSKNIFLFNYQDQCYITCRNIIFWKCLQNSTNKIRISITFEDYNKIRNSAMWRICFNNVIKQHTGKMKIIIKPFDQSDYMVSQKNICIMRIFCELYALQRTILFNFEEAEEKNGKFIEQMNSLFMKTNIGYLVLSFVRTETVRLCYRLFEGVHVRCVNIGDYSIISKNVLKGLKNTNLCVSCMYNMTFLPIFQISLSQINADTTTKLCILSYQ